MRSTRKSVLLIFICIESKNSSLTSGKQQSVAAAASEWVDVVKCLRFKSVNSMEIPIETRSAFNYWPCWFPHSSSSEHFTWFKTQEEEHRKKKRIKINPELQLIEIDIVWNMETWKSENKEREIYGRTEQMRSLQLLAEGREWKNELFTFDKCLFNFSVLFLDSGRHTPNTIHHTHHTHTQSVSYSVSQSVRRCVDSQHQKKVFQWILITQRRRQRRQRQRRQRITAFAFCFKFQRTWTRIDSR